MNGEPNETAPPAMGAYHEAVLPAMVASNGTNLLAFALSEEWSGGGG